MESSTLSLAKINNIERQINLYNKEISEIIDEGSYGTLIKLNSGIEVRVRDFYEYYINGQSLTNIIGATYWQENPNGLTSFFNSHVGCLGSFGEFWDGIYINILLKKNLTDYQIKELFKRFNTEQEIIEQNFLFYCCQDCGDPVCGGITFDIFKEENTISWSDNKKLAFNFDITEYELVFKKILNKIK
jgi:hypothetical protein